MLDPERILVQPRWSERERWYWVAEAHGLGLEIASFAHPAVLDNPAAVSDRLAAYLRELRDFERSLTLHGPFIDLAPHSPDRLIAEASQTRILAALELARRLGASHVIFHSGINTLIRNESYYVATVEAQADFWSRALARYPTLTVCLENMWERDGTLFRKILDQAGNPRLKVCLDVGHLNLFSPLGIRQWAAGLEGQIEAMHWNDNQGDRDSSLALGAGSVDWREIYTFMAELPIQPLITLEVESLKAVRTSLAFLIDRGMLPPPMQHA